MERRRLAHIALLIVGLAACGVFTEDTASAKTLPTSRAPSRSYVVKQGDGGWFKVAQAHGTTMPKLLAANHASAGTPLKVGQHIALPIDAKHARTAPKTARVTPARKPATH